MVQGAGIVIMPDSSASTTLLLLNGSNIMDNTATHSVRAAHSSMRPLSLTQHGHLSWPLAPHSQGGGMLLYGGTMTLTLTRIFDNKPNQIEPTAGVLYYRLPTAPGHWLPNSACIVYREACEIDIDGAYVDDACPATREKCLETAGQRPRVTVGDYTYYCNKPTLTQPCDWESSPELLGEKIYTLPLVS